MKRLIAIFACICLCVSFAGCAGDDTAWIKENAKKLGSDIKSGEIYINGDVFSFPMTLQDILDKGWHVSNNITNDKELLLGVGEYTDEFALFPDDNHEDSIKVSVINTTDKETTIYDCMVATLQVRQVDHDFLLPGEITKRSTQEGIEDAYGKPDEVEDKDGEKVFKYKYASKDGYNCYVNLTVYDTGKNQYPLNKVNYVMEVMDSDSETGWQTYVDACMKASFYGDYEEYVLNGFDTEKNAQQLYEDEVAYYAYSIMNYSDIYTEYVTDDVFEEYCKIAEKVLANVKWELSNFETKGDGTYKLELTMYPTNYLDLIDSKINEAIEQYEEKYATVDFDALTDEEYAETECDYAQMVLKKIKNVDKDIENVSGIKRVYEIGEEGFSESQWEEIDMIIMGFES